MDNTKKQNILIVHNYYQIPGGEDTVVANEKKMLEKNGHKVFLYNRNNGELKQMSKIKKIFLCCIGRRYRGYDDKRIYARNGRIQKKRSGEIFAFSYVLNGRKIHV